MTSPIKARIALPAFLLGNASRLCLLGALLVVPVGIDLGSNGLVFKPGAAYASDNGKMNDAVDNSPGSGSDLDAEPGFGAGSGVDPSAGSGMGGADNPAPGGAPNDGPDSNPDGASSDKPDNGQTPNPDSGEGNDNNSSLQGNDGQDSEEGEGHRGVMRPANLTEFLASLRNGSRIVNAQREGNNIEIEYSDGWQEHIEDGVYRLAGPNDNTIISRPATKRDYARLNSAF